MLYKTTCCIALAKEVACVSCGFEAVTKRTFGTHQGCQASLREKHQKTRAPRCRSRRASGPGQRSFVSASHHRDRISLNPHVPGNVPEQPVRTRFAPSPTGFLHIGGLRTALFSYLLAKRTNGQFILRIEDTDQKRLVEDAEQKIIYDLQWAGLQWDEGPQIGGPYGPYRQSERNDIYRKHARELLDSGAAYRCFCTAQTIGQGSELFVTSGCYQNCSSLSKEESLYKAEDAEESFTVRLVPPTDARKRVCSDLIYGEIKRLKRSASAAPAPIASAEDGAAGGLDASDTILVKSDGTPTYHFANVVDDHLMRVTHVIRGTEWMASTPLHYDLYHAFGWEPPQFAHVGLLLDTKKAKLSKRSGDLRLDVRGLREANILPEALVNFLALLGWRNPNRSDVMELRDMIQAFDLKFTKGNTVCDLGKLWFLQKQHVQRRCEEAQRERTLSPLGEVVEDVLEVVLSAHGDRLTGRALQAKERGELFDFCGEVLLADSNNYLTPSQFVERNDYLFEFSLSEALGQGEVSPSLNSAVAMNACKELCDMLRDAEQSDDLPSEGNIPSRVESVGAKIYDDLELCLWRSVRDWVETEYRHVLEKQESEHLVGSIIPILQINHQDAKQVKDELAKAGAINKTCQMIVAHLFVKHKEHTKLIMKFLRQALCCGKPGPKMNVLFAVLGRKETRRRLELVLEKMERREHREY